MQDRRERRSGREPWDRTGPDHWNLRSGEDRTFRSRIGRPPGRFGPEPIRHRGPADWVYGPPPDLRFPAEAPPLPRLSARQLLHAVWTSLESDPVLTSKRIRLSVDRGVVTLSGSVPTYLEARYAWDDTWETPGVRGVIDHLQIDEGNPAAVVTSGMATEQG